MIRVVIASEPLSYRESLGGALRAMRPAVGFHVVDPEQLEHAIVSLRPHVVLSSVPPRAESNHVVASVVLYPDGAGWVAITSGDRVSVYDDVRIETLLAVIDGARQGEHARYSHLPIARGIKLRRWTQAPFLFRRSCVSQQMSRLLDWRLPTRLLLPSVIVACDAVLRNVPLPHLAQALFDEPAHAATAGLWLLALPFRPARGFVLAALAASVMIDLDHIPMEIGIKALTPDAHRPYTHSLLTVAVVSLLHLASPLSWRDRVLGVAFGLLAHFYRDLATDYVPLYWPFVRREAAIPYGWYFVGVLVIVGGPHVLATPPWCTDSAG